LERDLAAHKMEAQMDLEQNDGFTIWRAFELIAERKTKITEEALTKFLEVEGCFVAKQPELQAILRRCDHDADGMLSKHEF